MAHILGFSLDGHAFIPQNPRMNTTEISGRTPAATAAEGKVVRL